MICALDIETKPRTDLDMTPWLTKHKDDLALYPQYSDISVIGISDNDGVRLVFRDLQRFQAWLDLEPRQFVCQRFMFDIWHLLHHGVAIDHESIVDDTLVMFHILPDEIPDAWLKKYNEKRQRLKAGHRVGTKHSLKTLAPYYLGVDPFWENPSDHDSDEYVLTDCDYTKRLRELGEELLKKAGCWEFYRKQMEVAHMLFEMKVKGMNLSLSDLEDLEKEYLIKQSDLKTRVQEQWREGSDAWREMKIRELTAESEESCNKYVETRLKDKSKEEGTRTRYAKALQAKIEKQVPAFMNIDSDDQLLWLLRDHLGYDTLDFQGNHSTGAEVLEKLMQSGIKEAGVLLDYREANKRVTGYFPTYRHLSINGVLHCDWNIASTRTGRLSSSNPNLQQVSPDLKRLFRARPGYKIICRDAAAIEAKLIAYYADDPTLYKIIERGLSIHDYRAKHVFFKDLIPEIRDCPVEEVKKRFPAARACCKNIGFARFYGAGWARVQATMIEAGFPVTEQQARAMVELDRSLFRASTKFHHMITDEFKTGKVICNMFGRPLHIAKPGDAYMKGFNKLIQSSASDLNVIACLEARSEYKRLGLDAYPIGLVHDEVIIEAKADISEQADRILVDKMTRYKLHCVHGEIPLTVEGGIFDVWQK